MEFDLTDRALLVVYEAVQQTNEGPVKLSVGLRFALAYLYATGERDLDQYQRFARDITEPFESTSSYIGNYMRSNTAQGHLNALIRLSGKPVDHDFRLGQRYERIKQHAANKAR